MEAVPLSRLAGSSAARQVGDDFLERLLDIFLSLSLSEREDFSVRLVPGGREGLVEVVINGRWGTVCGDNLWLQPNAEVVCNQLGLESESTPSVTPSTR